MSTELVSSGTPLKVTAFDRSFGGARKDVLVVSDGIAGNQVGDLGSVILGGRTVLGDPSITSTTLTATNTATLKLNDCGGNRHSSFRQVTVWLSTAAGGTTAPGTTGLTTTVTVGGIIATLTANLQLICLTDTTGTLTVQAADAAGGETRFVNFEVDGKVFSSAAMISPP